MTQGSTNTNSESRTNVVSTLHILMLSGLFQFHTFKQEKYVVLNIMITGEKQRFRFRTDYKPVCCIRKNITL